MPNHLDNIVKIALVGPPLGGKGSLVKGLRNEFVFEDSIDNNHDGVSLSDRLNAMILPIGVIFSKHTEAMTELGKAVLPYTSTRELVPDHYVNAVAKEAFDAIDADFRHTTGNVGMG